MKKRLVLLLVTAMAATTVLAGCGSKDSGSSDNGKKSSKEAKVENDDDTLIVGFDASFPPYGYKDDSGEYVGFDLDLAQEACDRNNWKLVKQPIDWDSKDAELNSGTIDCIWNGFTMNGREDDYTWSDPYIDNKQVVVVRSDSGIDDFAGLKGKHVEVQTDSSALAALEAAPLAAILFHQSRHELCHGIIGIAFKTNLQKRVVGRQRRMLFKKTLRESLSRSDALPSGNTRKRRFHNISRTEPFRGVEQEL